MPPPQPVPAPWAPAVPPPRSQSSRGLAVVSLGIALVAIGVAIAGWLRPMPKNEPSTPPAPSYSSQQVADAKAKVCGAYRDVHRALELSADRSAGNDQTTALAVATSGRQVLDTGSRYLLTKLSQSDATPAELNAATRNLSSAYQELAIKYLTGLSNTDQQLRPTLQAADEATAIIERLCG